MTGVPLGIPEAYSRTPSRDIPRSSSKQKSPQSALDCAQQLGQLFALAHQNGTPAFDLNEDEIAKTDFEQGIKRGSLFGDVCKLKVRLVSKAIQLSPALKGEIGLGSVQLDKPLAEAIRQ
jgi:hypothetical protein